MHLSFLQLPASERSLFFEQAAQRRGLSPVIMEKDFWVCWLLGVLFAHPKFGSSLVFKGGTSLSKVFSVIQRFSEDIDLSVSPGFLGVAEEEVAKATSRNQTDKWMRKMEEACANAVRKLVQPELERVAKETLGERGAGKTWFEFVTDDVTHSPVLLFHYPVTQAAGFAYLPRVVKLEFGSLTDQRPVGWHPVRPWVAEVLGDAFRDWRCDVVALEVERTFWEKATILHAEHYRPVAQEMPVRFSRHYADTAALAGHPAAVGALARQDLRERVVVWKSRYFTRSWAKYELAKPGTFRLVPPDARLVALRRDYEAMADMYIAAQTPFDRVIATLADLEKRINGEIRR